MAKNRYINTKFWEDGFVINLTRDEKILFLYFLTSPMTNISGVYECPIKIMGVHTDFTEDELMKMFPVFRGKIHYIDGWVYVRNFVKHQSSENASVKRGIQLEMENVPKRIKDKIAEIDIEYSEHGKTSLFGLIKEETKEEKDEKKKSVIENDKIEKAIINIVTFYNERINSRASLTGRARDKLKVRLKEFEEEQILGGIVNFSEDDWRMSHNKSQGMEWFFRSETQVQKWIELEPEKKEVKKVVKI